MVEKITSTEFQEEWLSSDETADFLKVSKKTLKRYRDSGKLPFSKDARKIRYKKSDIIKYLNSYYHTIDNTSEEKNTLNNIILFGLKKND